MPVTGVMYKIYLGIKDRKAALNNKGMLRDKIIL